MTWPSTTTSCRRSCFRPAREPAAASHRRRAVAGSERPRRGAVGGDGVQAVGGALAPQEHQLRGRPPLDPVGHQAVERQGVGLGPVEADDRERVDGGRRVDDRHPRAVGRPGIPGRQDRPGQRPDVGAIGIGDHELPPVAVRGPAGEDEPRPVGREVGRLVFRRPDDDRRARFGPPGRRR